MSYTNDIKSITEDIESSESEIREMLTEAIEECYKEKVSDEIINMLIKAKKELAEIKNEAGRIDDLCDEIDEEMEELEQDTLENQFEGIETIYWKAANFRDKEMMESLSECIDRKIPVPKIINVLSAL